MHLYRLYISSLELISQFGLIGRSSIRHQRDATQRTTHIRNHRPSSIFSILTTIGMLSLYADITIAGREYRSADRGGHLNQTWANIGTEVIVPCAIADMLLDHHAIPLTAGHHLIIIVTQQRIAFKSLTTAVGPLVGFRIMILSQLQVHGLCIIHLIDITHGLYREEYKLAISILTLRFQF